MLHRSLRTTTNFTVMLRISSENFHLPASDPHLASSYEWRVWSQYWTLVRSVTVIETRCTRKFDNSVTSRLNMGSRFGIKDRMLPLDHLTSSLSDTISIDIVVAPTSSTVSLTLHLFSLLYTRCRKEVTTMVMALRGTPSPVRVPTTRYEEWTTPFLCPPSILVLCKHWHKTSRATTIALGLEKADLGTITPIRE